MALATLRGLHSNQIPLEGQIIRVADEFDAIISKRQYKTHIGITDTLKILVQNAQPNLEVTGSGNKTSTSSKFGKINPRILKCLFKIVIDDTEYEISQIYDYLDYVTEEIKRLKQIDAYHEKLLLQKKPSKQAYYEEGINILLRNGETKQNYGKVLDEYKDAYNAHHQNMNKLFEEVKNIKKLKNTF